MGWAIAGATGRLPSCAGITRIRFSGRGLRCPPLSLAHQAPAGLYAAILAQPSTAPIADVAGRPHLSGGTLRRHRASFAPPANDRSARSSRSRKVRSRGDQRNGLRSMRVSQSRPVGVVVLRAKVRIQQEMCLDIALRCPSGYGPWYTVIPLRCQSNGSSPPGVPREPWVREVVHCVPDLAVPIGSGTRHLAAARVGTTDVRPRSLVDLSKVSSECFGPSVLPDAGAVSAPSS
jgi:hypothetical protein